MNGFSEVKKVLLVSGSNAVSDIIQFDLTREGYRVFAVPELAQGPAIAHRRHVDAVIIDAHGDIPEIQEYCDEIRKTGEPIPIIILSDEKTARMLAAWNGEHIENLIKPFQMKALKAHLVHVIRRTCGFLSRDLYLPADSEIIISTEDYQVYRHGEPIPLSQTEYELFVFLASHPGKVYSRKTLMERVWNYESTGNDIRMVDVAIRRLRAKIEDDAAHPFLIRTQRGVGYYFSAEGRRDK